MLDIALFIFRVRLDQGMGINPSELGYDGVLQHDWFGHVVRRRPMMRDRRAGNSQESGDRYNQHEHLHFHLSPPLMKFGPGITAVRAYLRCGGALGSKPAGSPISFKYC